MNNLPKMISVSSNRQLYFILFLLLTLHTASAQLPVATIDSLIHLLTPQSYRQHFDSLRTNSGSFRKVTENKTQSFDHDACRDYIFRSLKNYLGEENVSRQSFDEGDYQGLANVTGIKKGQNPQEKFLIISAHYDSNNGREENQVSCSPGANDNGTGVAAVLELARVVSELTIENTVIFALWDFEEQFTNGFPSGSNRWYTDFITNRENPKRKYTLKEGKIAREKVVANINFDMVGNPYDSQDGKPVLWACSGNLIHKRFVDEYVSTFEMYVPSIKVFNKGRLIFSDHYTFASRKIPSVENLESGYDQDPFYHTCSDNLENPENINFEFATNVARGGLAFLLSKAKLSTHKYIQPVPMQLPFEIKETINGYRIETRSDDHTINVYDCIGNTVPVFRDGCIYTIYPRNTAPYRIRLYDSNHSLSVSVWLQKKEGQPVPYLLSSF